MQENTTDNFKRRLNKSRCNKCQPCNTLPHANYSGMKFRCPTPCYGICL